MKKGLTLVLAILTVFAFSCATSNYITTPDEEQQLTILHTNDHHGHPLSFFEYPVPGIGGLPARATLVEDVRSSTDNVLVLDAGDLNTGTPASNFFDAEPDIIGYNAIGYDAMAVGNHEFDNDMETMQKQIAMSEFPWLCANVKAEDGELIDNVKPYVIKDMGGFKVAILGLLNKGTKDTGNPEYIQGLTFEDEVETANKLVPKLNSQADIVIALVHMGIYNSEEKGAERLAAQVPGLSAVISGHTHTPPEEYVVVTNAETEQEVPVVQAEQWGKYVGRLDLTFLNGQVTDFNFEGIPVNLKEEVTLEDGTEETQFIGEEYTPDEELKEELTTYADQVEEKMSQEIGTAEGTFDQEVVRKQESAAGNAVADSMMWYAEKFQLEPDFAFQNGGGVRADFPEGKLTIEDVHNVLPFDNSVVTVELTGAQVTELFESTPANVTHGAMPQVSEEVSVTINAEEETISDLTIGGEPVDPEKTYTVATNSYLAAGGDGYAIFKDSTNIYNTSAMQRDAFVEYVQEGLDGELVLETDGRLTVEGEPSE